MVVDAKQLPPRAVERVLSPRGFYYYKISFQIAVHFKTTLEFKLMFDGKEYGHAVGNYL
jgi:hypothetical protein